MKVIGKKKKKNKTEPPSIKCFTNELIAKVKVSSKSKHLKISKKI